MEPKDLETRLLEMPEKIRRQDMIELELLDKTMQYQESVDKIKLHEQEIILSATENGKPKYSNEAQRKVALEKALEANGGYKNASDALDKVGKELKLAQIEGQHFDNVFKTLLAIAGMGK